jgi:predicted PhzF superfamily epimerase YddE/YHI9
MRQGSSAIQRRRDVDQARHHGSCRPRVGVVGAWDHAKHGSDAQFEVLALTAGGYEDPVTGSLNAGLAQWLIGAGIAASSYAASQRALGRMGRAPRREDRGRYMDRRCGHIVHHRDGDLVRTRSAWGHSLPRPSMNRAFAKDRNRPFHRRIESCGGPINLLM